MLNEVKLLGVVESVEIKKSEEDVVTNVNLIVEDKKGVKTIGPTKVFQITFKGEVADYLNNDKVLYGDTLLVKGKLSLNDNEELYVRGSSYVVIARNEKDYEEEEEDCE